MKNENTKTEAERIAKAFNQLANAIGNLCKAVRKAEVVRIPKTAPLPNPKGLHESNIDQRIKEWVEAIEIWKNNLINKNSKTKPEPNDPLAGMHVDENNYPDYVCIKDYVFVNGRVKKGSVFKYELDITKDKKRYVYHEDTHSSYSCDAEEIKKLTEHFKKVETVETFDENKRFNDYICVKDFRDLKVGDVLKFDRADSLLHEYIFICQQANDGLVLMNIDMIQKNPSHFVEYNKTVKSEYAFKMQKNDGYYANQKLVDQDKIEFHDKDGFAWFVITKSNKFWQDFAKKKAEEIKPFEIKKNADGSYYFEIEFGKIEQTKFYLLEENQIITFTLKNGKTYTAQVLKDSTTKMYYLNSMCGNNAIYFHDLNQFKYKNNLNLLYGNNDVYPSAPNLECLTNDLNTLIQLPDLSCKQPETSKYKSYVTQANELIENFMPLVTGWVANGPPPLVEVNNIVWSLSDSNKRKAAIKVAIKHCDLFQIKLDVKNRQVNEMQIIKEQLQKMLSE